MKLSKMLTIFQDQTTNLIPASHDESYLVNYQENPGAVDSYYMGVKYGDLATISDDINVIKSTVEVSFLLYNDKWTKMFNTLNLEYNPLWNVDATIVEEHNIDARHMSDTFGNTDMTTETGSAPMDTATYHNQNKTQTTSEEHTNDHDEDAYIDTITTTRTGNIGVTTAAQLIEGERKIADFNFLDVLMTDIINTITYPYFTED